MAYIYICILTFYLIFFLAYTLTFLLASNLTFFSGILSGIYSGIYSGIPSGTDFGIHSGIFSDVLSGILSDICSDIQSGILSGIYSDIFSRILGDIPFDILSGILSGMCSGPGIACPVHPGLAIWFGSKHAKLHPELTIEFGTRRAQLHPELAEKKRGGEEEVAPLLKSIKISRGPYLAGGKNRANMVKLAPRLHNDHRPWQVKHIISPILMVNSSPSQAHPFRQEGHRESGGCRDLQLQRGRVGEAHGQALC